MHFQYLVEIMVGKKQGSLQKRCRGEEIRISGRFLFMDFVTGVLELFFEVQIKSLYPGFLSISYFLFIIINFFFFLGGGMERKGVAR